MNKGSGGSTVSDMQARGADDPVPAPVRPPRPVVDGQVSTRRAPLAQAFGRRLVLGALLAAAGLLYSLGLSGNGWANAYYSAAAQAGSLSWQAFLFGGLDPAGGITVDKPPAALWLSGLSVRLFGLSTPSLLLPQALCAVGAVALLYATVRRQALTLASSRPGLTAAAVEARAAAAGLVAAVLLAVAPLVTLMARYDNPDTVMVLLSVAAAYTLVRSLEGPRGGGWLAISGALLGLAFLTKLMQAWLVVPAFVVVALVAGAGPLGRRLARVAAAGAAMIAGAGWWVLVVQLTPAAHRPWIGGSRANSVIELALGYNGLGRVTGQEAGGGAANVAAPPSWGRLFGPWASDASWLLPAALVALVAGWALTRGRDRRDPVRAGVLMWGGWLLVVGLVLSSLRGIAHSYYAIQLAPAIAGVLSLGGMLLWQQATENGGIRARRVLAGTVTLTAVWSTALLMTRPAWPLLAAPVAVAAAVVAVVGLRDTGPPVGSDGLTGRGQLSEGRGVPAGGSHRRSRLVAVAVLVATLAGPTAWSVATAQSVHRGSSLHAGPGVTEFRAPAGISPGSTPDTVLPLALVQQVRAGAPGHDWAAAMVGRRAADLQLASGASVWCLGGFYGRDPHPTLAEFRLAVAASRVHYLALARVGGPHGSPADQIARWAYAHFPSTRIGGWYLIDLSTDPRR